MKRLLLAGLFLPLCLSRTQAAGQVQRHWAYDPIQRPQIPTVRHNDRARTPIDTFVLSGLEAKNLSPTLEADKRTLLRRVYFDLIGLPPNPEQVRAFLSDSSANAYQKIVDSLLDSPRYGERWARHWLDIAHFAETHGHDQDRIRTNAWPYRDYLIQSFNADKAYDRLIKEQIAGDVLFPDDPQATVALGFLAAGPWDESSLRDIREDTLDRQIARYLDRDDVVTTVMQTFTSTTVQCARCHDHKFDPISQQDYYSLQAVFAGVERANRIYDLDPAVHRRRQELLQLKRRIEQRDTEVLSSASTQGQVAEWEKEYRTHEITWTVLEPETFSSDAGSTLRKQSDNSLLANGSPAERDTYKVSAHSSLSKITAVRLEVLPDPTLPGQGPGRQENGNFHLSEFQLLLFKPHAPEPQEIPFIYATADFDQDGWGILNALDGKEKSAWGIHPKIGERHEAVFELSEPFVLEGGTLVFVLKQLHGERHVIGRFRLSVTADTLAQPAVASLETKRLLAIPAAQRNADDRMALATSILKEQIARHLRELPKPSFVYAAASDFEPDGGLKPAGSPRPVHVLHRGEITQPREFAQAGALSCIASLPTRFQIGGMRDESARRGALAHWLASAENPLTWRSIVNRVWHYHFGRGLVETPNDFGRMAAPPTHPELLDWLAAWFRDEARGSFKQLHRLIVFSAVYRQASTASALGSEAWKESATSRARDLDSENRLLGRMNRTRLDAEQVRDAILQISGRLELRMGGPSDMQFDLQPGIHVTPRVDYAKFDLDSFTGRRRSIYRFLFRTLPDPFMDALDCPAGDQATPFRNASVTVQQALALWNDAFAARHAEHFAARLDREAKTLEEQVRRAFELALSRPATATETRDFSNYAAQHGLANFCRLLFNSNEFIFVN